MLAGGLLAVGAQAQPARGLLAPSAAEPARLAPGQVLSFVVRAATGLTPPPGVQEDRAHRAFSARLCADGLGFAAPERVCFALPVRNVRPRASHSLEYRVDVPLPAWLAPSTYDLGVRFPGGSDEARAAVVVGEGAAGPLATSQAEGRTLARAPAERAARLRVHLGRGTGLGLSGASFTRYPLPDQQGRFSGEVVAIVQLDAGATAQLWALPGSAAVPGAIGESEAAAGEPAVLEVQGAPADARVFWWLDPERGAIGPRTSVRFVAPRHHPVEALVIGPDGRASKLQGGVVVTSRRVGSCALAPQGSYIAGAAGLLSLALSWTLGAGRRVRRPGAQRAHPSE